MSIVNSRSLSADLYEVARYCRLLFFLRFFALANKAIVKTNSFERGSDMLVLRERNQAAHTGLERFVARVIAKIFVCLLIVGAWHEAGLAADPNMPDQALETRIQGLIPDIERYITSGMKSFDVPGLAIGIVVNDKLVYGKGFGVRAKEGGGTVIPRPSFRSARPLKPFSARRLPSWSIAVDSSGTTGDRSLSRFSIERPLGHARIPCLRFDRSTLESAALC